MTAQSLKASVWVLYSLDVSSLGAVYVVLVAASLIRSRPWQLLLHIIGFCVLVGGLVRFPRSAFVAATLVPLALVGLTVAALALAQRRPSSRRLVLTAALCAVVAIWAALKFAAPRSLLASFSGRHGLPTIAAAVPGVSYLVLKLVHVLADSMSKRPPTVKGTTLLVMSIFAPTYAAGPIHRYEEFAASFDSLRKLRERDWGEVLRRLIWGAAKFSVVAPLVQERVAPILGDPAASTAGALWLAVYGYAIYIYCNFSGVSDIAIGIGEAFGITVPENFRAPYYKLDIQQFWQSWHITLTRWLQAYVFLPISRRLMKTRWRKQPKLVAAVGYLATFALCGLWHGEAANYVLWGLYHGLGLCAYTCLPSGLKAPTGDAARKVTLRGAVWWAITFHFVCLGWVMFASPASVALLTWRRMVGAG